MLDDGDFNILIIFHSKAAVEKVARDGRICILDIDVQGVRQVKQVSGFGATYVFVKPPSLAALEARLRGRNTETEDSLQKRLAAAQAELDYGQYIN
jgi:guanylate kinase